jgi:hypothetical protein
LEFAESQYLVTHFPILARCQASTRKPHTFCKINSRIQSTMRLSHANANFFSNHSLLLASKVLSARALDARRVKFNQMCTCIQRNSTEHNSRNSFEARRSNYFPKILIPPNYRGCAAAFKATAVHLFG